MQQGQSDILLEVEGVKFSVLQPPPESDILSGDGGERPCKSTITIYPLVMCPNRQAIRLSPHYGGFPL